MDSVGVFHRGSRNAPLEAIRGVGLHPQLYDILSTVGIHVMETYIKIQKKKVAEWVIMRETIEICHIVEIPTGNR